MTKIFTVLICFLFAACSAKYLGTSDIQYTSQGNRDIQNLQWQWPSGTMSSPLTLIFPRKTYIHSIDVITCCFESSQIEITAKNESDYSDFKPIGDPKNKAKAVFTYYVKDDGKEGYSVEEITLKKGSQVLLMMQEIGGGGEDEWEEGEKRLDPKEFSAVPSDFTGLYLSLRQRSSGNDDDMEFDFGVQIYHHSGSLIHTQLWRDKKLSSDEGKVGEVILYLDPFQYEPEHHIFQIEKYANTIEMAINVELIQNLIIQSIRINSPDCASNQYYMNGCKDCHPLCKSCFGPNPDEECFDCKYGKGPNLPYGNCCPEWCKECDEENYCKSCVAHTPIYNYWDGVCYRPCELSEYFLGSDDEKKFFPCHERCLSCTNGGPQDCIICRYGRGVYDDKCCPPFCEECDTADKCTLCMDGFLQYQFQCYKTCPGQLVSYDVLKCEQRDVDTRLPITPRDNISYKLKKFVPARHFFSQIDPSYANNNWKCYNEVSSATIGEQGSFLAATAIMLRVGGTSIAKNAEINPNTLASTLSKFFIDEKCRFLFNFDRLFAESSVKFKKNFLLMKGGEPSLIDLMSNGTLAELYKLFDYQQIYNSYLYIASDSGLAEKDKYIILTIWKIISKEDEDDLDYSSHAAVLFEWKDFDSTQAPEDIYNTMTLTIIDPLKPKGSSSPTQQFGLCFEDSFRRGCLKELKVYEIIQNS